ncbi:MAG: hypothetical protein D6702_06475 [Planctomycetota bacterium]|nr:MAG: hypothetical protein D6702_06475 [Planctomycetota bacterium]
MPFSLLPSLLLAWAAQEPEVLEPPRPEPDLRVLFLGDVATAANGLPKMVAALAASSRLPWVIETEARAPEDATLERHWVAGRSTELIRSGDWDVVVLQESARVAAGNPVLMLRNGRLLAAEVRRCGARPLLFLPWAPSGNPEELERMEEACRGLAEVVGAPLAPIGSAWRALAEARPDWPLRRVDGRRPTRLGSYLAACVLLGWLADLDPRALDESLAAEELSPDEVRFLHELAARFVPPEALLPSPFGLHVDRVARTRVGLRWDRPDSRPAAWRVESRAADGEEPFREAARLKGSAIRWADTEVRPGAARAYRVWAVTAARRLTVPADGRPVAIEQALAPDQRCEISVLEGRIRLQQGEGEEELAAGDGRIFSAPAGGVLRAVARAAAKARIEVSVLPAAARVEAIPPLVVRTPD